MLSNHSISLPPSSSKSTRWVVCWLWNTNRKKTRILLWGSKTTVPQVPQHVELVLKVKQQNIMNLSLFYQMQKMNKSRVLSRILCLSRLCHQLLLRPPLTLGAQATAVQWMATNRMCAHWSVTLIPTEDENFRLTSKNFMVARMIEMVLLILFIENTQ